MHDIDAYIDATDTAVTDLIEDLTDAAADIFNELTSLFDSTGSITPRGRAVAVDLLARWRTELDSQLSLVSEVEGALAGERELNW